MREILFQILYKEDNCITVEEKVGTIVWYFTLMIDGQPCKKLFIALVKWQLRSWQDPAAIPVRIAAGSRRDFGCRNFESRQGSRRESRQDSRREANFPAAKISAWSLRASRQESRRDDEFPAAKILAGSWRDSRQESQRDDEFPAAKISAGSLRDSRQES